MLTQESLEAEIARINRELAANPGTVLRDALERKRRVAVYAWGWLRVNRPWKPGQPVVESLFGAKADAAKFVDGGYAKLGLEVGVTP